MASGPILTHGDRRRRVLTEELIATNPAATAMAGSSGGGDGAHRQPPSQRYTAAASYEQQSRLTDVIPRWRLTIALFWLVGVLLVAGLIAIDLRAPRLAALIGQTQLPALTLSGLRGATFGSLATWVASTQLGLAAFVSVLIYSVRRHRIDDYHGRYRIWLWVAFVCLLLSLNTTAGLHRLLVAGMAYWTGWSALPGGAIWWLAPLAALGVIIGWRLLGELRACPTALVLWITALLSWGVAVGVHLGFGPPALAQEPIRTTVVAGAVLGGHLALLTALLLYARHVILDAEGRLVPDRQEPGGVKHSVAEAKPQAATGVTTPPGNTVRTSANRRDRSSTGPTRVAVHSAAPAARVDGATETEPARRTKPRRKTVAWTDGSDGPEDPPAGDDAGQHAGRRLSKAERKRLRKQKQRERQRRVA